MENSDEIVRKRHMGVLIENELIPRIKTYDDNRSKNRLYLRICR